MEVIKIISLGIVISIITVLLKQVKPEFAIFTIIAGGIVMLFYILNYFTQVFAVFNEIVTKAGIDSKLFGIIFKVIGVGYLVEFGASACVDSGNSAIGDKIILGGKIIMFSMALPIITNLFNMLIELLS